MVTLLLSTAALVLLTALGAGALLYVAASSKEVDESEEAERSAREKPGARHRPELRAAEPGPVPRGDRRG